MARHGSSYEIYYWINFEKMKSKNEKNNKINAEIYVDEQVMKYIIELILKKWNQKMNKITR